MSSKITFSLQAQSDTHEHIRVIQRRHTTNAQDLKTKKKPLTSIEKLFVFFADFLFVWRETTTTNEKQQNNLTGFRFFDSFCLVSLLLLLSREFV
jgi:hypothetical protein